ncbi:MAG: PEP-CTERM sorting domain-containing protein [Microcoleaceae cyanobacterium]
MKILKNFAVGVVIALATATPGFANTLLPPDESFEGRSQEELAVEFWQYVNSIPANQNPLFDLTGENAGVGQSGSLFFLVGVAAPVSPSGIVERAITVSEDQSFFLPLIASQFDPVQLPFLSIEQIEGVNEGLIDVAQNLFVTLDGVPFSGLETHRQSPEPFSYELVEGNTLGLPSQTVEEADTDGFFAVLNALPAGEYTLTFGGELNLAQVDFDDSLGIPTGFEDQIRQGQLLSQDITYQISVKPVPEPTSMLALLAVGLVGFATVSRSRG